MTEHRPIVMAVDDDEDDILLLQDALAQHYSSTRLLTAQGVDAFLQQLFGQVESLEQLVNAVPAITPELILLDVNMPKINGLQLLQFIRKHTLLRLCKVVMLTTSVNPNEQQRCIAAGADMYLVKPCAFDELEMLCALLIEQVLPAPRSAVKEVFNAAE